MSTVSIDVRNVYFSYEKNHPILTDITFQVRQKEAVGIIGANGVGKSTLLKLLVGLEADFSGDILIENLPLIKKNLPAIRRKTGYVFQDSDSQLFMSTVYEDVAFAPRNYGLSPQEIETRVQSALEQTGIGEIRNKPIYKLSGGEKKLASIASILSMEPDILLMDEPSAALDPKNRRNLIRILNGFGCTKLITSHDLDFIWDTCPRTILMSGGRIILDGETKTILSNEKLLEEYGLELPLSLYRHESGIRLS